MKTNDAGKALIKQFEGLRLTAYVCPAGRLTIGFGHTGDVQEGQVITAHQAEAIFEVDLDKFERAIDGVVSAPLNENQFSSLVCLAMNIGITALAKSTLLRRLNARDYVGASLEFPRWNHINGVVSEGLTQRRFAERALFLSPVGLA